ncbi:bifunctional folylpolyglutamate synthase/dihydrofolate synthase [Hephaestia sp. GCM10023244]|uniref:bifunctional folylpolyglutamate synthase/dihydrofolate synthase n=1 Tax=unclassified Hephaestia TaxID=2631281 RepID=UPI00207716DA|nr:folylpolyglutamate synthase/dihydrofolate synthase family protein [Hephaestia sp. MAHUQ-44]MCM8730047.1 bifunctional folylpolyglutamate synthase/dihydrofolate synthase [Hephaestia sp. MAHUQ-44]
MPDHAISSNPAVQRQLDRLWSLSPGADVLGLDRITRLLDRLGNPQHDLPPVLHVAGTNGKGSTCAFLRGAIEAAGLTAHVYSSPHLVRFNERIRVAGTLIADATLAALLEEVLDHAGGLDASFFEVTTAVAFLAFARTPADACIVEVGLGGRLDATNILTNPLVTGIAQLGIDHQAFLGDSAEGIAAEKAGIAKAGVPLVTMHYAESVARRIAEVAAAAGAPVKALGVDWSFALHGDRLRYRDAHGAVETSLPNLPGPHQPGNLALAIAMLRHQTRLAIPTAAFDATARRTRWPARMQQLADGPLTRLLPPGSAIWLDGGHNQAAGAAVATAIADLRGDRPLHLICGMLANKDATGFLAPLARQAVSLTAVPIAGHAAHAPEALAGTAAALGLETGIADTVSDALRQIAARHDAPAPAVLIVGSLYLAGEVLAANDELPV